MMNWKKRIAGFTTRWFATIGLSHIACEAQKRFPVGLPLLVRSQVRYVKALIGLWFVNYLGLRRRDMTATPDS
jgi:hypothetical protein